MNITMGQLDNRLSTTRFLARPGSDVLSLECIEGDQHVEHRVAGKSPPYVDSRLERCRSKARLTHRMGRREFGREAILPRRLGRRVRPPAPSGVENGYDREDRESPAY